MRNAKDNGFTKQAMILVLLAFLLISSATPSNAQSVSCMQGCTPFTKTKTQLVKLYNEAVEKMKLCSPLFAAQHTNTVGRLEIAIGSDCDDRDPKEWRVTEGLEHLDIDLRIRSDSMRIVYASNGAMFDKYFVKSRTLAKDKSLDAKPTLSREAAIERAKKYLNTFQWEVPQDFKLSVAKYEVVSLKCKVWRIVWKRFSDAFEWDEESLAHESIRVQFHEKDGLDAIWACYKLPPPKSLEVKLTSEQAIAKATSYADVAKRIVAFSDWTTRDIRSCVLRVAAPNYKLRASGALYKDNRIPKETRLCWVVTFYIQPPNNEKSVGIFGLPAVYVDAETGKVFGFDCDSANEKGGG